MTNRPTCPRCDLVVSDGDPAMGSVWHHGCLTDHLYDAAKDYEGHATEADLRGLDGVGDRFRDPDGHAALEYSAQIADTVRART